VSLLCGIIFGIGLVISEMINPEKVLGFLNIFRDWDPSLAFVMIGALVVSTPVFHLFKNKKKPKNYFYFFVDFCEFFQLELNFLLILFPRIFQKFCIFL
jgi:hypothetical protein